MASMIAEIITISVVQFSLNPSAFAKPVDYGRWKGRSKRGISEERKMFNAPLQDSPEFMQADGPTRANSRRFCKYSFWFQIEMN